MKAKIPENNWPVIGHDNQIKFLQKNLVSEVRNHAYLFTGPENIGKGLIAKIFSQALVCDRPKNTTEIPCGQCQNCLQFTKKLYSDFFEINLLEDKQDISMEQIKNLQARLKLKSLINNYKVAVIYHAEKLNQVSANALLKTLEEPYNKTVLILITNDLKTIIPTIVSRSQIIKFNYVSDDLIYDYLVANGAKRNDIKLLVKLVGGRPGLLFESDLENYLNKYKNQRQFLEKLIDSKVHQKISLINENLKDLEKNEIEEITGIWLIYFRDVFFLKYGLLDKVANQDCLDNLTKLVKNYSLKKIISIIKILSQLPVKIRQNLNAKILLENLIINL